MKYMKRFLVLMLIVNAIAMGTGRAQSLDDADGTETSVDGSILLTYALPQHVHGEDRLCLSVIFSEQTGQANQYFSCVRSLRQTEYWLPYDVSYEDFLRIEDRFDIEYSKELFSLSDFDTDLQIIDFVSQVFGETDGIASSSSRFSSLLAFLSPVRTAHAQRVRHAWQLLKSLFAGMPKAKVKDINDDLRRGAVHAVEYGSTKTVRIIPNGAIRGPIGNGASGVIKVGKHNVQMRVTVVGTNEAKAVVN